MAYKKKTFLNSRQNTMVKLKLITQAPSTQDSKAINYKYGGKNHAIYINKSSGYVLPNCCGMVHYFWLYLGLDQDEVNMPRGNANTYYGAWTGSKGKTPKLGAVAVWKGGSGTYAGYGHVGGVQKIYPNGDIECVCSDASGSKFYTRKVLKSNSYNWSAKLQFVGFIYPSQEVVEVVIPNVERNTKADQVEVKVDGLRVRLSPSLNGEFYCFATKGYYNVLSTKDADGYTWLEIETGKWIAFSEDWETYLPAKNTDYDALAKQIDALNTKLNNLTAVLQQTNEQVTAVRTTFEDKLKSIKEVL